MLGKIYNQIFASGLCAFLSAIGAIQTNAQICAPAPVGLVSIYSAENNALDARSRLNGTLQGGAGFAVGKVGQAFSLNGTDAFVQAPSSPANDPTTAGSLEAWVKFNQLPSAAGHTMEIIGKGGGGTDFDLQAETDNRIRFYVAGSNNVASTTVVQTGVWYHVVGAWDSTVGLKMYVNGVLENTLAVQVTRGLSGQPVQIGNQPTFGPRLFSGLIDEASIYNRALNAADIQAIYAADAAGKCKPVATSAPDNQVSWFAGDGDARDFAGTNNGTLSNGAAFAVGKVGQGFLFDGVDDRAATPNGVFAGQSQATVEAWIRPRGAHGGSTNYGVVYFENTGGATLTARLALQVYNDGSLAFSGHDTATGNAGFRGTATAAGVAPQNVWTHISGTWQAGVGLKIYVNGALNTALNDGSTAAFSATASGLSGIGNSGVNNAGAFNGDIDEVSLYNRALSPIEIQSIYNADLAGKLKQTTTTGATVTAGDATVTFPSAVSTTTQETPLDLSSLPALPAGATSVGLTYDVATGAQFSGNATVCFVLPALTTAQFQNLGVLHLENGTWIDRSYGKNAATRTICARVASLSPFAIAQVLTPTAASVTIGGRVTIGKGRGIANARVSLTDAAGETRTALSNSFGYYRFANVRAGETYVVIAAGKRFQFDNPTRVIYVTEDAPNIDFVAEP